MLLRILQLVGNHENEAKSLSPLLEQLKLEFEVGTQTWQRGIVTITRIKHTYAFTKYRSGTKTLNMSLTL